ncbi:hypothetical protein H5410_006614 [Solanum commersonii]|uniref:Glycosyl transferase 48 domain-containing protein n=1 Tax=Solanum commersonii TaxID=4109 RepID=A0A9J6AAR4_SOLCO|nr:hypothetical protein H5410_006614 [Solanum commersonii]
MSRRKEQNVKLEVLREINQEREDCIFAERESCFPLHPYRYSTPLSGIHLVLIRGMMYCRKLFLDMVEDEGSIPRKASRSTKYWRGKAKNQNHSIIFRRGEALQTIDMNQDNYLEEALKMRNILQEFLKDSVRRPPTILGMREHIFTGRSASKNLFLLLLDLCPVKKSALAPLARGFWLIQSVSRKDATSTSKSTMEKMHKKRGGQVGGGSIGNLIVESEKKKATGVDIE